MARSVRSLGIFSFRIGNIALGHERQFINSEKKKRIWVFVSCAPSNTLLRRRRRDANALVHDPFLGPPPPK